MNGACGLPAICAYAWFSIIITNTCSRCGIPFGTGPCSALAAPAAKIAATHEASTNFFIDGTLPVIDSFGIHMTPWVSPCPQKFVLGSCFARSADDEGG